MDEKKKICVCFSSESGLNNDEFIEHLRSIKSTADEQYGKDNYVVLSCHVGRTFESSNFQKQEMQEMFDCVFGLVHKREHRPFYEVKRLVDNVVFIKGNPTANEKSVLSTWKNIIGY